MSDDIQRISGISEGCTTAPEVPDEASSPARSQVEILEEFSVDWVTALYRDDKTSLAVFLCHQLVRHFR